MPVKRGKNICIEIPEVKVKNTIADLRCAHNGRLPDDTEQCSNTPTPCRPFCGKTVDEMPVNGYYTQAQWSAHNEDLLKQSIRGHRLSTALQYNVHRTVNAISSSADKNMFDTTLGIRSTARELDRWMKILSEALRTADNEIDALMTRKSNVQKAKRTLTLVCSICTECLERRSFRLGVDLMMDDAQEELLKEKTMINEISALYCDSIRQIQLQVDSLKSVKLRLELNWSFKSEAYDQDAASLGLNFRSPNIAPHPDLLKNSESACLPDLSPDMRTNELYEAAKQAFKCSEILKYKIDNDVLKNSGKRLRDQADAVDIALARYISGTHRVRQSIEDDLYRVVQRLGESEELIKNLQRMMYNLETAKMAAESRLYIRTKRPRAEQNYNDKGHLGITSEVRELNSQIMSVNRELKSAKDGNLDLQNTRLLLEDECRVKRKTLWTDCVRCQNIRSFYPCLNALIGH